MNRGPFPPTQLIPNLMTTYAGHLQRLYHLGARKFGIISVPPIGCCPAKRYVNRGGCVGEMNDFAQDFYTSLRSVLQNFSSSNSGVKYSLANTFNMTMSIINNPHQTQFKEVKSACCGNGAYGGGSNCEKGVNLCSNRKDYLFWDRVHPTQAASELFARVLVFDDTNEFVTPMNFSRLAMA